MLSEIAFPQPDSSQTAHQFMAWSKIRDIFCADHAMLLCEEWWRAHVGMVRNNEDKYQIYQIKS